MAAGFFGTVVTSRPAIAAAMLVVLLSGSLAAQAGDDASGDTAEVRARERALTDAMHARDRAGLDLLLAPDYVLRGSPDIDRSTWIQNAATLCWGDRSDIDAFHARQLDQVIVASFELTFYVDPSTCRPAVLRSLITDIWTRHADGWRLQIRHSGQAGAGIAAQFGAAPQPPPAWVAASELSLVATGGNTSTRTIGLGGDVTHRTDLATTRGSVAFLTSETDAVASARSLTTRARHGIRVSERIELFGEGSYSRDRFAGIGHRTTTAAGAAFTAMLSPRQRLATEGSIGFTAERRLDATRLRFATATGALGYAWTFAPGIELTGDAGMIGDLATAGNWRGTAATAVSVGLTRLLSLKASHAIEYRNTPVAGFGRTDMRTAAALVVSLQRPSGP